MITMILDWHDFLFAIEGFARGSHLRQHIWQEIVIKYIPQMSDKERDKIWFYFRRDIWPIFFDSNYHVFGDDDFLHCMAAMQRNNYATLFFREGGKPDGDLIYHQCYRFQNKWYVDGKFTSFVPDEWVLSVVKIDVEPTYMEQGKEDWWANREVYNLPVSEVRKSTERNLI